nr:hypothetical protein [Tanacetum cinerariifolium]
MSWDCPMRMEDCASWDLTTEAHGRSGEGEEWIWCGEGVRDSSGEDRATVPFFWREKRVEEWVNCNIGPSSLCALAAYKTGLESVEARIVVYQMNETVFEEDIKILKIDVMLRENALAELRKKFKKAKKERYELKLTLEKFQNSSKNLSKLLESQVSDKVKTGVGFDSQVFDYQELDGQESDSQENDRYKTGEGYHAVSPPYTRNFMPSKLDLVIADIDEHVVCESKVSEPEDKTSKTDNNVTKLKSINEPIIEEWESDSDEENEMEGFFEVIVEKKIKKCSFAKLEFAKSNMQVKPPREYVKRIEINRQAEYPRKNSQSPRGNKTETIRTKVVIMKFYKM